MIAQPAPGVQFLEQIQVNLFKGSTNPQPVKTLSVAAALASIQDGTYEKRTLRLRAILQTKGKPAYDAAKKQLPAVTFCRRFSPTRAKANLTQHTGIVHGDIDGLDDLDAIRQALCSDRYTLYCFTSPSGTGLKIGGRVAPVENDAQYKHCWQHIADYHLQHYGITWDPSGKDISRLCYMAYDPDCYINPDAPLFPVPLMVVPPPRPQTLPKFQDAIPHERRQRYAQQAIETAIKMIDTSVPPTATSAGTRHATRLKASRLLGGYVAGGILTYAEAHAALEAAVRRNTDDFDRSMQTVNDGIAYGQQDAFTLDQLDAERLDWLQAHRATLVVDGRPVAAPTSTGTAPAAHALVVIMADVEAKPVEWLWWPYIAIGKLAMLDGDPGIGKSLLTIQLAASLSHGFPLPDQQGGMSASPDGPQTTLLLSTEDGLADTIKPRLDDASADSARVKVMTGWLDTNGKEQAFTLQHIELLEQAMQDHQPRLVVIDPIQAYFGSKIDIHRSNETRPLLDALTRLAAQYRCAVVCIRHPSKPGQGTGKAIHRGLGSIDFIGAARTGLFVEQHPTDPGRVLLAQSKSNIGPLGRTQIFTKYAGQFQWCGVSRLSAELIAGSGRGPDPTAFLDAVCWLEKRLKGGLAWPSADIEEEGLGEGHKKDTLRRAKKALGVVSAKTPGSEGGWTWRLPPLAVCAPITTAVTSVSSTSSVCSISSTPGKQIAEPRITAQDTEVREEMEVREEGEVTVVDKGNGQIAREEFDV